MGTYMVQVRRVKRSPFYIMIVMFWLPVSRVFEVTMKNIEFVIWKDFFSHFHLHVLQLHFH